MGLDREEGMNLDQGEKMNADDACLAFVSELDKLCNENSRMRESVMERWRRNVQQYYSQYPDEVKKKMDERKGGSQAFYNLTRPRTRTMNARLADILLPTDTPNWAIRPTAVPELASQRDHDLQIHEMEQQEQAEQQEQLPAPAPGQELAPQPAPEPGQEMIAQPAAAPGQEMVAQPAPAEEPAPAPAEEQETPEQEELRIAKEQAERMGKVMTDQLQQCHFVEVERKCISQSCKYGTGVVKGPFAGRAVLTWKKKIRKVKDDKGREKEKGYWELATARDDTPAFEQVDLWNFIPDMNAMSMEDCEFVFEVHRMNKKQVQRLILDSDFIEDEILDLLRSKPSPPSFHQYIRELRESAEAADETYSDNRYYLFEYHGPIPIQVFKKFCNNYQDEKLKKVVEDLEVAKEQATIDGVVWFCQGKLLRFGISRLDSGDLPYSVFRDRSGRARHLRPGYPGFDGGRPGRPERRLADDPRKRRHGRGSHDYHRSQPDRAC